MRQGRMINSNIISEKSRVPFSAFRNNDSHKIPFYLRAQQWVSSIEIEIDGTSLGYQDSMQSIFIDVLPGTIRNLKFINVNPPSSGIK